MAMPSISFAVIPQSAIAFKAASACNWICARLGILPRSVVSAAPIIATDFCSIFNLLLVGISVRKFLLL